MQSLLWINGILKYLFYQTLCKLEDTRISRMYYFLRVDRKQINIQSH